MRHKSRTALIADVPSTHIPSEVLNQFVDQLPLTPDDVEAGLRQFKKAVVQRALGAELHRHLRSAVDASGPRENIEQHRSTRDAIALTQHGPRPMQIPPFDPRLISKGERHFGGIDDKIVALHARGLTRQQIQAFIAEMYGADVPLESIGVIVDAIANEVTTWQARPLESMYPVVFLDAVRVRIGDEGGARTKLAYVALAILPDGTRDVLGLWIHQSKAPTFWLDLFNDLRVRGCQDILIAVTDHADGVGEALTAVFPETTLQTCIVQLIRHSLEFATWKERHALASYLRPIYTAHDVDAARTALDAFERSDFGARFPTVVGSWRRAWTQLLPLFALPPELRRVIYTTSALENLHAQLLRVIKARGHFRSDDAANALIWLALHTIAASWARPTVNWKAARNQFAILYEERFTRSQL